jgi:hypothetical protein
MPGRRGGTKGRLRRSEGPAQGRRVQQAEEQVPGTSGRIAIQVVVVVNVVIVDIVVLVIPPLVIVVVDILFPIVPGLASLPREGERLLVLSIAQPIALRWWRCCRQRQVLGTTLWRRGWRRSARSPSFLLLLEVEIQVKVGILFTVASLSRTQSEEGSFDSALSALRRRQSE